MSVFRKIGAGLVLYTFFCGTAWGMDFTRMSTQELAGMRGAMQKAPETERSAYQKEWEKRLAKMTEEERKQYDTPAEQPEKNIKLEKPVMLGNGYEEQNEKNQVLFGGGAKILEQGEASGGK